MKKVVVGVALLVVILGTGGYAVAQSQGSGASYRTATARTASVEKTLNLSGTVSSAGRRDLSFGASGTVQGVSAKAGKRVRRNQVLARLDATSLDATVTSAVATLAKAKAQLVTDEDAQSDAVAATAAADEATRKAKAQAKKQAAAQAAASAQAAAAQATAQAELRKQQQAVTSAQSAASDAIRVATSALADEQSACTAASGTTSGTGSTNSTSASGPSQACTTALSTVQDAQQTVAAKQQALQSAIATLTRTVTSSTSHSSSGSSNSSGSTGHGGASSAGAGSSSGSSAPSSTSGASGRGGATVTAATLARDQASIDTATAELTEARAARRSATLRAPFAGRIVKVAVSKGDTVSASDTAFVLVGSGVTEVTTSVTSTQLASVRRGQRVTVTPAGWSKALVGVVTLVGLLPDSSSSYPLVVTVQSPATVAEDTTASLAIVTGSTSDAVTVPTSAVTRLGSRAVVQVLTGTSTVTRRLVTVGVVGNRVTSLTTGLKAGEQVVIADLGAALPSSGSTTGTRRFGTGNFGGGGFGGTGGPPAAGRTGG